MTGKRHKVEWTETALEDLLHLVSYIHVDSPPNAARVLDRLEKAAGSLDRFPLRGRIPPELLHLGVRAYREIIIRPYRIVYRVTEPSVVILAVVDSRRDLADLLLERMLRDTFSEKG